MNANGHERALLAATTGKAEDVHSLCSPTGGEGDLIETPLLARSSRGEGEEF